MERDLARNDPQLAFAAEKHDACAQIRDEIMFIVNLHEVQKLVMPFNLLSMSFFLRKS